MYEQKIFFWRNNNGGEKNLLLLNNIAIYCCQILRNIVFDRYFSTRNLTLDNVVKKNISTRTLTLINVVKNIAYHEYFDAQFSNIYSVNYVPRSGR